MDEIKYGFRRLMDPGPLVQKVWAKMENDDMMVGDCLTAAAGELLLVLDSCSEEMLSALLEEIRQ